MQLYFKNRVRNITHVMDILKWINKHEQYKDYF